MNISEILSNLNTDCINTSPEEFNFSSEGYGESWELVGCGRCDTCGEIVETCGEESHKYIGDSDCEGYVVPSFPMMNYLYPLPTHSLDLNEIAKSIVDLPLCVVTLDDDSNRQGFALSGGGMDMSWDIALAYILAGYYPPIHFAKLPQFVDMADPNTHLVLAAMIESVEIASLWLENDKRHLVFVQDRYNQKKGE